MDGAEGPCRIELQYENGLSAGMVRPMDVTKMLIYSRDVTPIIKWRSSFGGAVGDFFRFGSYKGLNVAGETDESGGLAGAKYINS